jgi:hypothetical protein
MQAFCIKFPNLGSINSSSSNSTRTQQQADLPEAHKTDIYPADVMQISVDNVPQACIP